MQFSFPIDIMNICYNNNILLLAIERTYSSFIYICYAIVISIQLFSPQVAQPSTSRISATKRKFGYRRIIDEATSVASDPVSDQPSTIIVRTGMLGGLVKNLSCPSCKASTLGIRAVSRNLGLVCQLETFCSSCDSIVNSVTTSDRLDKENAANTAFVVTRSAVAATMDMGVGHAGLVKLCRYLDMAPTHHSTYSTHVKAITHTWFFFPVLNINHIRVCDTYNI